MNILSAVGTTLFGISCVVALLQVISRLFFPWAVPPGLTTLIVLLLFFGSANLLAVALVGEYLSKVFEEVKRRPWYIRRNIIRNGEVRLAAEANPRDSNP